MPSLRAMRLRMRSVRSISQVTRALEAVSASKVRRAQQAVLATRPYAERALQVLRRLGDKSSATAAPHPLLSQREPVRKILIVVVASDRGLCGAYNTNIVRTAVAFAREQTAEVQFVSVGRKARELLLRRRQKLVGDFSHLPANPAFIDVSPIGRLVVDEFISGDVDEVYLAYTDYVNTLHQDPRVHQLLPLRWERRHIDRDVAVEQHGPGFVYDYEPSPEALLDAIVPRLTQLQVYQGVLEGLASEHSARMVAMRNATDAAGDLLDGLQLRYNKARQLSITSELLDIVGGVEAMAKAG